MPRSSQMRRKMIRSIVCCTAKFSSRLSMPGCAAQGLRQEVAPALDLGQERRVDLGGAALAPLCLSIPVQGAVEDRVGAKTPAISSQRSAYWSKAGTSPGQWTALALVRLDPAVVDRELFEVGQDAEGQFGAPRVAAELVGGCPSALRSTEGFLASTKNLRVPPMRKP